jgi:putative addiction module antidote
MKAKIISVGNSAGIILPKELLDSLKVEKGDTLYIRETPSGYEVSQYDPDFDEYMEAARIIMRENRDALRRLAGHDD